MNGEYISMSGRRKTVRISEAEWHIMNVLWDKGAISMRELHENMPEPRSHFNTVSTVVRRLEEQGFINARKRDSQDICFIPDGDYLEFIKQYTGKHYPCGDFLDENGKVDTYTAYSVAAPQRHGSVVKTADERFLAGAGVCAAGL